MLFAATDTDFQPTAVDTTFATAFDVADDRSQVYVDVGSERYTIDVNDDNRVDLESIFDTDLEWRSPMADEDDLSEDEKEDQKNKEWRDWVKKTKKSGKYYDTTKKAYIDIPSDYGTFLDFEDE